MVNITKIFFSTFTKIRRNNILNSKTNLYSCVLKIPISHFGKLKQKPSITIALILLFSTKHFTTLKLIEKLKPLIEKTVLTIKSSTGTRLFAALKLNDYLGVTYCVRICHLRQFSVEITVFTYRNQIIPLL